MAEGVTKGKLASGKVLVGLVLPVGAAILYEIAARLGVFEARLLPPPSRIFETLWKLAASGELQTHVIATLWRVAMGFGFGAVAGIVLGALTGA